MKDVMASSSLFNRTDSNKKVHVRLLLIIKGYMVCLILSGCLVFLYFFAVFSVVTELRKRDHEVHWNDNWSGELFVAIGIYISLLGVGLIKQPVSWIGVIKHRISWIYGIIVLDIFFLLLCIASFIVHLHYSSIPNLLIILFDITLTTVILWELKHLPENRPEVIELQASLNKSISSRTSRKSNHDKK
jgi:hypothetical protein